MGKAASSPPVNRKGPRLRPVPAVTRALAILRLLGRSPTPMSLKVISESLGLVPSTCLHILRVLVAEELVKVDPEAKRYSLGVGMLALARSVMENATFASLAQPSLDKIAQTFPVTAMGVETSGQTRMIVVALSRTDGPFRLHVNVGSRFPALISATGRCVAAFGSLSEEEIERGFRTLRWDKAPTFEAWLKEVERVRRDGFAVDRGNYIAGVTVVAVPVFDSGKRLAHTLVATGVSQQLENSGVLELVAMMREEAAQIASILPARPAR